MMLNLGEAILKGHGQVISNPKLMQCYLRVKWGEWGPEHITVPGNACGLDLDGYAICRPGEVALSCHNVDCLNQASMLLTIFLRIANILESENL